MTGRHLRIICESSIKEEQLQFHNTKQTSENTINDCCRPLRYTESQRPMAGLSLLVAEGSETSGPWEFFLFFFCACRARRNRHKRSMTHRAESSLKNAHPQNKKNTRPINQVICGSEINTQSRPPGKAMSTGLGVHRARAQWKPTHDCCVLKIKRVLSLSAQKKHVRCRISKKMAIDGNCCESLNKGNKNNKHGSSEQQLEPG